MTRRLGGNPPRPRLGEASKGVIDLSRVNNARKLAASSGGEAVGYWHEQVSWVDECDVDGPGKKKGMRGTRLARRPPVKPLPRAKVVA
jgi:hypothetical protein